LVLVCANGIVQAFCQMAKFNFLFACMCGG